MDAKLLDAYLKKFKQTTGRICELKSWKKVVTPDDVESLFQNFSGRAVEWGP